MLIIGLDPGTHTGVATYRDGNLVNLETYQPHQIADAISGASRVVFEDSRLQSHTWSTVRSRPAALKMARNVGEVDAWCKLIVAICADCGITSHGISPLSKGAKLNAIDFQKLTGWSCLSNEHTRDAAMVAWPYRRASA